MHHLNLLITIALVMAQLSLQGQQKIDDYYQFPISSHEEGGGDDIYFGENRLYIPERDEENMEFHIKIFTLDTKEKLGLYHPPTAFKDAAAYAIDNEAIYFHTDGTLSKVDMNSNKVIWEAEYSSGMAAQIAPNLFANHVGISLDDRIFIIDKATGKEYISIEGEDFDQSLTLTDKYLLYGEFETGRLHVYDVNLKKDLFELTVGDQLGESFVQDGHNLIFPSTNLKLSCVNGKTGKEQWTWSSSELKGGCGHGFNDAPALFGDKLYVNQRETGLYIFDKNKGQFQERISFNEDICTEWVFFDDKMVIIGTKSLYLFDPASKEIKTIAEYPEDFEAMPYLNNNGRFIALHNIGSYDSKPIVRLFDLEELINGISR